MFLNGGHVQDGCIPILEPQNVSLTESRLDTRDLGFFDDPLAFKGIELVHSRRKGCATLVDQSGGNCIRNMSW